MSAGSFELQWPIGPIPKENAKSAIFRPDSGIEAIEQMTFVGHQEGILKTWMSEFEYRQDSEGTRNARTHAAVEPSQRLSDLSLGAILVGIGGALGLIFFFLPLVNLYVFDEIYGAPIYERNLGVLKSEGEAKLREELRYDEFIRRSLYETSETHATLGHLTQNASDAYISALDMGRLLFDIETILEGREFHKHSNERRWALLSSLSRLQVFLFLLFAFSTFVPVLTRFMPLRWPQLSLVLWQSLAAFLCLLLFFAYHLEWASLIALFKPTYWIAVAALGMIWVGALRNHMAAPDGRSLVFGIFFTLIPGAIIAWPIFE